MSEKIPENKKTIEDLRKESEDAMNEIERKYGKMISDLTEEKRGLNTHHEAVQSALDTLSLLHQELIHDLSDTLIEMTRGKAEVSNVEATAEEVEAELQKNPVVSVNLKKAGLTSLMDENVDQEQVKQKILWQILAELNAKAVMNQPQHVEHRRVAYEIQNKLSDGLEEIIKTADFGEPGSTIEVVETKLKESAIASKKILDECLREARELFFNR